MSARDWKLLPQRQTVTEAAADESGGLIVEVWSYDPAMLAGEDVDLKAFGLGSISTEDVLRGFRELYRIA